MALKKAATRHPLPSGRRHRSVGDRLPSKGCERDLGFLTENAKLADSADQSIVAPVLTNLPRKFCITLTTFAESVIPLHSISNDTMAGTGATGGTPRAGNPRPLVRLLYRSCASVTETSRTRSEATPAS